MRHCSLPEHTWIVGIPWCAGSMMQLCWAQQPLLVAEASTLWQTDRQTSMHTKQQRTVRFAHGPLTHSECIPSCLIQVADDVVSFLHESSPTRQPHSSNLCLFCLLQIIRYCINCSSCLVAESTGRTLTYSQRCDTQNVWKSPTFSPTRAKGKSVLVHAMKEYRDSTFLTSKLDGGEWFTSCPGRFTPRTRTTVPLKYYAGWAQMPGWTQEKNFLPMPGF
jgi:hypothetical protein